MRLMVSVGVNFTSEDFPRVVEVHVITEQAALDNSGHISLRLSLTRQVCNETENIQFFLL